MKKLFFGLCFLAGMSVLHAQQYRSVGTIKSNGWKNVFWMDNSVVYKEQFPDLFRLFNIDKKLAFQKADANDDKEVSYDEFGDALKNNLFMISFTREQAIQYCLYMDWNMNGYIDATEGLEFEPQFIDLVESLNHKKFEADCGKLTKDQKERLRATGNCKKDKTISVSEFANAAAMGKIWIGNELYWKN